jgi:hypothetical protein
MLKTNDQGERKVFSGIRVIGDKYRPTDRSVLTSRPKKYLFSITASELPAQIVEDRNLLLGKLKTIESLQKLPQGWDGLNAECPNRTAVNSAKLILVHLFRMKFLPDRITPSVENGVGISFVRGEKYADIECFNSGEILAVISDRRRAPTVWEVNNHPQDITSSLRKIRDFIR